jgi:hypothetical protein
MLFYQSRRRLDKEWYLGMVVACVGSSVAGIALHQQHCNNLQQILSVEVWHWSWATVEKRCNYTLQMRPVHRGKCRNRTTINCDYLCFSGESRFKGKENNTNCIRLIYATVFVSGAVAEYRIASGNKIKNKVTQN